MKCWAAELIGSREHVQAKADPARLRASDSLLQASVGTPPDSMQPGTRTCMPPPKHGGPIRSPRRQDVSSAGWLQLPPFTRRGLKRTMPTCCLYSATATATKLKTRHCWLLAAPWHRAPALFKENPIALTYICCAHASSNPAALATNVCGSCSHQLPASPLKGTVRMPVQLSSRPGDVTCCLDGGQQSLAWPSYIREGGL